MKATQLVRSVLDVQPAGAGKSAPITRLLVKYKPNQRPTPEQLAAAGLKPVPGKESKAGSFLVVEAAGGVSAETLTKLGGIESVDQVQEERSLRIPPQVQEQPTDAPSVPKKGGVGPAVAGTITDPFFADGSLFGMKMTHITNIWAAGHRKSPVVVAVIDTGVDLAHTDLTANLWVNAEEKDGSPGGRRRERARGRRHGYDFYAMTGE